MTLKKILLVVLVILVIIQFIPINVENPEHAPEDDLFALVETPIEIQNMMKSACYDCHSYETKEPWYFNIAPVSWWLVDHVNEGREHLNFSTWGKYEQGKQAHKMEESAEEVEEVHMPLDSYTWMHPEADLTEDQRAQLISWFEEQYEKLEK